MNASAELSFEALNDPVLLPSQYNDLIRRRSPVFDGEHRLLWAVLEDAIRTYAANVDCSTQSQRAAFEEVRGWFQSGKGRPQGLFAFQTICDLLGIDSGQMLKGLDSIRVSRRSIRRHRTDAQTGRFRRLAA